MAPPVKLPTRRLGKNGPEITAIGFGLMGLSTAYGSVGADEERLKVLDRAWELGCTNWDWADMYADSEDLLAKWFARHPDRRPDIFLATKFGLRPGSRGLVVDSSPEYCRQQCQNSLRRMGVDYIDLYYIHRVDGKTPVEKTMGELVKLKQEGKIRHIGISACSADTLRRASAVAQVDAYQFEHSPWVDIEVPEGGHVLDACRELGVTVFAYAPLVRGIMTGRIKSPDDFPARDPRRLFPRFSKENFPKNLVLVDKLRQLAARKGCTPGQLIMAWLMAQREHVIIPIPGTTNIQYLEENVGAVHVLVTDEEEREIRKWIDDVGPTGVRTPPGLLGEFGDTPPL